MSWESGLSMTYTVADIPPIGSGEYEEVELRRQTNQLVENSYEIVNELLDSYWNSFMVRDLIFGHTREL